MRQIALIALPFVSFLVACGGSEAVTSPGPSGDVSGADVTGSDATAEADVTPATPKLTAFPWSAESWDEVCADGKDNDGNNFKDCGDFACTRNPAVTVCDVKAAHETSPAHCTDGKDNDGDYLVDCADPDCAKNPYFTTCPALIPEADCTNGLDDDGDGLTDCGDADCLILWEGCPASGRVRVLFDQVGDETAALGPNSDWIIDSAGRAPWPSNPKDATDWSGSLSSLGFELWSSGAYLVESLPSWSGRISFSDATNPQDLGRYGVVVMWEPSRQLTPAEKDAVVRYVLGGGSLLCVANHDGADRDGNGWSAPNVWNDLFDTNTVQKDPFGFRFDAIDGKSSVALGNFTNTSHAVLQGKHGKVGKIGYYDGCTAHLTGTNPKATGLVLLTASTDATQGLVVGAAEAGKGRVVFLCDSAIGADGTDSHGNINAQHDSWHKAGEDDAMIILNAMDWLARLP